MAEIKIEKKTPVWPWILLLLVLAALAYYFFFRDKEGEQEVIDEVDETTSMVTPQADENDTAMYSAYAFL